MKFPPQRLDTRAAAEEVVERLHGRVIRLDDSGTRISVRFADTTEQRELRVSELSSSESGAPVTGASILRCALWRVTLTRFDSGWNVRIMTVNNLLVASRWPKPPCSI